jgi:hypothetical protein
MPDAATLLEIASEQGGVFTPAQAKACGWTHHGVLQALNSKHWKRLHPGVLVDASWFDHLDLSARHLVLLHARLQFRAHGWHAARRSAALVHGLPIIGKPPTTPQLVRDKNAPRLRGVVRHERISTLPPEERTEVGVPVSSLGRTVADLARDECFRNAVVVADAALRAGADHEELLQVAKRCSTWPGGAAIKPVVHFASGLAETPLESISRVAFRQLSLPAPELQVEIRWWGEFVARVDFLWRAQNCIGEADGRSKYDKVEDFYEEKRREERLRDLGFEIARWDWNTAYRPDERLRTTIARSLSRGVLNTLDPGVRLVPTGIPSIAA